MKTLFVAYRVADLDRSSPPTVPLRRLLSNKGIRTSLVGVLNCLLVSGPGVGDRSQAPPSQQAPHLLEAGEIMRGVECLIVLRASAHDATQGNSSKIAAGSSPGSRRLTGSKNSAAMCSI